MSYTTLNLAQQLQFFDKFDMRDLVLNPVMKMTNEILTAKLQYLYPQYVKMQFLKKFKRVRHMMQAARHQ